MVEITDIKVLYVDKSVFLNKEELINSMFVYKNKDSCIKSLKFILNKCIFSKNGEFKIKFKSINEFENIGISIKGNKNFYRDKETGKFYYKLKVYNNKTNKLLVSVVYYKL